MGTLTEEEKRNQKGEDGDESDESEIKKFTVLFYLAGCRADGAGMERRNQTVSFMVQFFS